MAIEGAAVGLIASLLASYLGGALVKFGLGPMGSGRMAARGFAAAQAKLALNQLRQQLLAAKLDTAYRSFASENAPGTLSQLIAQPVVGDPRLTKLASTAAAVANKALAVARQSKAAKKLAKKAAAIDAKIDKRQAKLVPDADYRVVAKYGLASGPPITGSRDDPEGMLVIRHAWSE